MRVALLVVIMVGYLLGGLWLIGKMNQIVKTTIYKNYGVPTDDGE